MFSVQNPLKMHPHGYSKAMESVAGRVEELTKSKVKKDPPPPFLKRVTPSLYSRIYSSDGKEARNKRAQQRAARTTAINKLGEDKYRKLLQEIDLMTHMPANIEELINKRMKEIDKRQAAEQQEKEASERRQTRSQTDKPGTSAATDTGTEQVSGPEGEPEKTKNRRHRRYVEKLNSDGRQTTKTEIYYQTEERIWWQEA